MFGASHAGVQPGEDELSGAAATEVVTMWGDTAIGVKHFPHTSTFGNVKHITPRGETAIAGACMVAGGVVLGPAVGQLVRRFYHPQVVSTGGRFTLGEDPTSDIWVVPELIDGRSKTALVEADDQGSRINLLAGMSGEVTLADGRQLDILEISRGASSFELPVGARARLRLGDFTFLVNSVLPGKLPAINAEPDWSALTFTGFSFLIHAVFLFLVYFIPPDPRSLSLDMLAEDNRFVRYVLMPPEIEQTEIEDWAEVQQPDQQNQGGEGRRHEGEEGQMGRPDVRKNDNRFAIKGPADNIDPQMARERVKEAAASSGILAALQSEAPTSPFGADTAIGNDPENALGALMGSQIGDNFGYGGLGLRGTGRGGGGDGRGTIGLGRLNTIGHGAGGGKNQGYGRGTGNLHSRRARGPDVVTPGSATVHGALSREVIRRYIRRNLNQIRYCYEQELVRRPDLAGRVQVQFVISQSGAVSSSSVANSTMGNANVEQCVSRAVGRIAFPQPDGGGVVIVTYPFMFQPAE
jgi:TonB family protein